MTNDPIFSATPEISGSRSVLVRRCKAMIAVHEQRRGERKLETAQQLQHRAFAIAPSNSFVPIAQVYQLQKPSDSFYRLETEYSAEGQLEKWFEPRSPLKEVDALRVTLDIARALHLNQQVGIVHCKVRLSSILIVTQAGEFRAKT
ncbi:MAG: hypothetical protein HC822_02010 [Oscillochloris sp.]|nr:hypothetical protein [Oscillochloris sp.]